MCGERRVYADKRMETTKNRLAATLYVPIHNIRRAQIVNVQIIRDTAV